MRLFVAYWLTMLGASVFMFCLVLSVQGIAAQLLPWRWFLRASSSIQLAAFCGLVSWYMLQPSPTPSAIAAAQHGGWLFWSPSYWFLGLFQQLCGMPVMIGLANRAWFGLGSVLALAAISYLLFYYRMLGRIVEQPDILTASGRGHWLPGFGGPLHTALTQFSIRTLLRSRQHRLILAFYWGLAFAFVILVTKSAGVRRQLVESDDPWSQPNVPLLVASIMTLCLAIVGMRAVVALPLELKANWIFQVTPVPGGSRSLPLARRPLYALGLAPVWFGSAILFAALWPWQAAAAHLLILLLLGVTLTEVCLAGFQKIPFACSYLPGKSRANIAVLAYLGVAFLIGKGANLERQALEDLGLFARIVAGLAICAITAWWRTTSLARSGDSELQFEEKPAPAIFALDLHRDGTPMA